MNNQTNSMHNKVPEITIFFWIIKVLGTTVGETAADYLSFNLKLGLTATSIIMAGILLAALVTQIRYKKYVPWIYWVTVVLISIVGTLITDDLVENFGISLKTTTILFGSALVVTFVIWYKSEKTLSIHSIYTIRREIFYWAAILFTFAFGTAFGDLLSEGLNWGYAISALIFAGIIGLVMIAYYKFKLNAILSFWIVYVLTRPLGASMGDLLTAPVKEGGWGIDSSIISTIFLLIIVGLVVYLTRKQNKILMR